METQLQINSLGKWGINDCSKPIIISGPCSAETEEQVIQTAKELKSGGIHIYRAGIWKPRTRPNSFEGVGSVGLEWLKRVKTETGMSISTEVANVKHVYESLKAGIDILWIGARTTANPFAIQEIADALKGVKIPVLIKNPVNPDVELWIGALERFYKAGITNIGAIHRGFSSFEKSIYRNIPQWQIPIELKSRIPNIPLFCDPSHIAGNRHLLRNISQKALDLNFDGLMIESHTEPDKAWSDAKQQITPENLKILLNDLIIRHEVPDGISLETLDDLRYKIDQCDDEILNALENRMKLVQSIGWYKKENKMTILQPGRWDKIFKKSIDKGLQKNLKSDFVSKIFKTIHQESINEQTEIMNIKAKAKDEAKNEDEVEIKAK
ncbi:MAG: bifunctional 3-deoxy-7-phosphoheptulonate synthase/chorismate mutase type II [Bacteroidota bacterium]|nr:bifunctional 3-deoxy-7-phosphoheptulonate synthase/chorismate mutase type II [Bacteroidota bacterium]